LSAEPTASVAVDEAAAEPRPPARRACLVMLGGRPFAVDVTEAREVVVLDVTTPVPGAPPELVGVMNLRGHVLPVVEARPLLGLPVRAAVGRSRAVVVADGAHRAAVLIERVLGLSAFDQVLPPADGAAPDALAVGEMVDEAGERATVLNACALLSALRRAWEPDVTPAVPADPGAAAAAPTSGA
jgi:purine-binding chemotaxis protein CheW